MMLTRLVNSQMFQSVLVALARGLVGAALAYFAFLVKHVHDYETIIGTCGIIALIPFAGLLHLVVPAVPGLPSMAQRWPRIGGMPPEPPAAATPFSTTYTGGGGGLTTLTVTPPEPPRPEQSSDTIAAAVQHAPRKPARIIPPTPPVA